MLNGIVEPLLTVNSSSNRLISLMMTKGDSNSNSNEVLSRKSTMKTPSSSEQMTSTSSNNNSSLNSDNRIKFVDMLICGSCQQDFQLSDILNFIEHKTKCGNKENRQNIPYHFPQRRRRRRRGGRDGDHDDAEEEDDDDEDEDDDKSQRSGNSTESESENSKRNHQAQRQKLPDKRATTPKVLIDASANSLNSPGKETLRFHFDVDLCHLAEPYNFECNQCGDIYSTGNDTRTKHLDVTIDILSVDVQRGFSSSIVNACTA